MSHRAIDRFLTLLLMSCLAVLSLGGCGGQSTPTTEISPSPAHGTEAETPPFATPQSPSPTPTPENIQLPSGTGPSIAFISDRNGSFDIYLTDIESSFVSQLTDRQGDIYFPEFSPMGDRIMYWSLDLSLSPPVAEIRVMTSDGARDWVLGPALGWSSWSPDGNEVVLVAISSPENEDILHIDAQGNPTWLTSDPDKDREPDWSPDGSTIAFTSYREGVPQIYLMNVDGSNQRRLTTFNMNEFEPDWSPDGSMIAFVSGDDISTQIYIVDSDGRNLRQLTNAPGYNENPTWSPDGTMIAFWSDRTGNREIFIITIDGSGLTQITNHLADDENPTWAP